jgi:hypothetical protein
MQQADLRERKARIGPQRTASGREPQYITCADRLCASARASGETKTRRPPVRRQADKAQNYVIQKTGHVYKPCPGVLGRVKHFLVDLFISDFKSKRMVSKL